MFTSPTLQALQEKLPSLNPVERKSLITIARAQKIPDSTDTILASKVNSIFPHIFNGYSETEPLELTPLSQFGIAVDKLVSAPHLTGLLLVLCLELPDGYDTELDMY
jgi:hypothetical protein